MNLLKGAIPEASSSSYWGTVPSQLACWANFGVQGLDLRPAITCLIGVFLAVALNKVTSYYTHTSPRSGQGAGQGLHHRPRHQHHPGLRRGL